MKRLIYIILCLPLLISCKPVIDTTQYDFNKLYELSELKNNKNNIVSVTKFGAIGDGKTSATKAFQKAIDYLHKKGGGTLEIPKGVFLLTNERSNKQLLVPRPGVSIIGAGNKSVLKVADNTIAFNIYYSSSKKDNYQIRDAVFKDFVIDCNGENNIPEGKNRNKNACIGTRFGKNILIDHVIVKNNAGRQCFPFGNNEMPFTVQNIVVQNCTFINLGRNVPGNIHQNDHSAIYAQADYCLLRNNKFNNFRFETEATAMEVHASHCLVENNEAKNFGTGCNVVAFVTDMQNVLIRNNNFNGIERGMLFYIRNGHTMKNVTLKSNKFVQLSSDTAIIDASVNVDMPQGNLTIIGNTFENIDKPSRDWGAGIKLGRQTEVTITDNTFITTAGPAIQAGRLGVGILDITIANNKFENCAKTLNSKYQQIIAMKSRDRVKEISISKNDFINTRSQNRVIPISGNIQMNKLRIKDNDFENYKVKGKWKGRAAIGKSDIQKEIKFLD